MQGDGKVDFSALDCTAVGGRAMGCFKKNAAKNALIRKFVFTNGKMQVEYVLQRTSRRQVNFSITHNPNQRTMKVLSSLASMKRRHADCQIVKRKGTLYVICKSNPKFKARQGATAGTRLSKKGVK